jgi:transcription termination factor Rho
MVMANLRELAAQLGITNTAGMRKGDLISAIKERQGAAAERQSDQLPLAEAAAPVAKQPAPAEPPARPEDSSRPVAEPADAGRRGSGRQDSSPQDSSPQERGPQERGHQDSGQPGKGQPESGHSEPEQQDADQDSGDRSRNRRRRPARGGDTATRSDSEQNQGEPRAAQHTGTQNGSQNNGTQSQGEQRAAQGQGGREDDDDGNRRRGRRFRDRNRRGRNERPDRREGGELEVREDDVLLPVAGILDVLDNYAFVRTSGYLSGPNDVYVSLSLVRRHGLRRGDAITGAVRQPRDGEQQRQKFNPLVRVDTINGLDVEEAKHRPEFTKLTPLYPNTRLRLETEQNQMTTRVIDLIMPIGKGQRALIVSPPKAGKTMILQAIANAITTNNPECHLMVVLVDERPEEVTDMQRSVKGEVIASTFDRPPSDHTSISELAIERAKRLVEMGHDVVVLLDSITRLGRAYNLAAPASGRILSGGVDSTALYPPKRFLGAARNIEDGGSLTIFATALVETGSTMDTVIFEEFKGTGNAELKLDRKIADKRIFPAIDVNPSGTRKEELLLSPDELAIHHKLRRVLSALESQQAIDLLLDRLRKTRTNIEFLMQVSKSASGGNDD